MRRESAAVPIDAKRESLTLPGGGPEISLLDWGGDGPPALLHHANGFCAALWAPVAEKLRQRFRVFGMDARGHGHSSKLAAEPANYAWHHFGNDARAVAEHLVRRHGRLALGLGHSFGGTSLTLAALDRPDLFERLVLLDPIVPPSDPEIRERMGRGNLLAVGARRRREVWESAEEVRAAWARKETFAGWDTRALDLYVEEGFRDRPDGRVELRCPRDVEATIFESSSSVDVMDEVPRLETPALIVWASAGNFPREHFEQLASRMQRGEVCVAPTGHFVPMEDADFVVSVVLELSARPGAAGGSSPPSPPAASARG